MKSSCTQGIEFSRHGRVRLQQRGICPSSVMAVLAYGKTIHKQHLKFFFLPKSLINSFGLKDEEGLSKLIVITDLEKKEVITCYKSEKAVRKIKKKPKRLSKKRRFPTWNKWSFTEG